MKKVCTLRLLSNVSACQSFYLPIPPLQFHCYVGPGMINFKNIRFRTPLHFSCSYAGYEGFEACRDISFYLVSLGGDLKVKNKDNLTPLVSSSNIQSCCLFVCMSNLFVIVYLLV